MLLSYLYTTKKISHLLGVLTLAFVWAYSIVWLIKDRLLKNKVHGRPGFSIFRYGLDFLQEIIINRAGTNGAQQFMY